MPTPQPSNEELLEQYRNADFASFDAFFRRNQDLILNFLQARLGNRIDAEDAFQETFIRIHRSILTYDASQKALAWVLTIARNAAIDLIRKRRRQPTGGHSIDVAIAARTDLALSAREELTRIMARLTDDERLLIEGRFLDDAPFEELAKRQGMSAANSRQKLSRLLKKLKADASS